MIEPQKLIDSININCKNLFINPFRLKLYKRSHNSIFYRIEGSSKALNRFDYPSESVDVLKWFRDFWIFLEIKFIIITEKLPNKNNNIFHIYISLSVFQGEDSDYRKYQLFRAEWDDNYNPNENHSQPHWHITANQAIERTFEEYSKTFDKDDFLLILEDEKQKVIDVNKIHFAMNGNWQSSQGHVHKIDDEDKIVKWLQGIIAHLRVELEYVIL